MGHTTSITAGTSSYIHFLPNHSDFALWITPFLHVFDLPCKHCTVFGAYLYSFFSLNPMVPESTSLSALDLFLSPLPRPLHTYTDDISVDGFDRVLAGNKIFASRIAHHEPELLQKCAQGQAPEILWLGCADSRIPETTVCDLKPGDLFVHRNIANVIIPEDLNSASVIEYAVSILKIKRIMVCGHTKCGGANAAMGDDDLGTVLNNWLHPVRELRKKHQSHLDEISCSDARANRLAELNVHSSLETLKKNPTVGKAMTERGLTLHGVIYDISAGELRVLDDIKEKHSPMVVHNR